MKACPYCAEQIQDEAILCRFCNRDVRPTALQLTPVDDSARTRRRNRIVIGLAMVVLFGVIALSALLVIVADGRGIDPAMRRARELDARDRMEDSARVRAAGLEGATMNEFDRVAIGMSVSQVEQIIGMSGEISLKSDTGTIYRWRGSSGNGVMSAHFRHDRLISKSQSGLR